jgi:hypothetical protein
LLPFTLYQTVFHTTLRTYIGINLLA